MARVIARHLLSACAASSSKAQHLYCCRPELDFEFLLDQKNLGLIKKNVQHRKGVGDIDLVHNLWRQIQKFPDVPNGKEEDLKELWDKLYQEALLIPNMCDPEVVFGDESCAKTVRLFGSQKREESSLYTAEELVKTWKTVVYPRETSGSRSYAFVGPLADIERALIEYVWSVVLKNDFRPVSVSDIVSRAVTDACGLQQRTEQGIQYFLEADSSLCLSGTSEMGISNMLRGQVFREEDLPLKFTALSRCYRPEISQSVHEARLYRVHEFTKIEMFVVCKEADSDKMLQEIVNTQCSIFESLNLHCRLLDMPSEELGAAAARKFDVEAWMPGRKVFGEISSASNCTDFQARRLDMKYKDKDGKRKFVHTCNGTAVATSRAIIALLETLQAPRKHLKELPPELRSRMPGKRSSVLKMQRAPSLNPF